MKISLLVKNKNKYATGRPMRMSVDQDGIDRLVD